jgi:hypothetical protein
MLKVHSTANQTANVMARAAAKTMVESVCEARGSPAWEKHLPTASVRIYAAILKP